MTKEQAELLDKMMDIFLQRANANQSVRTFADEMQLIIKVDKKQIESYWDAFLSKITFHDLPVVDYIFHPGASSIRVNSNTASFVEYGGFRKYYEEEMQREANIARLKQLEEQKLLNDIASFRITKKQFIITAITAGLGFIIALITFVFQFFIKTN